MINVLQGSFDAIPYKGSLPHSTSLDAIRYQIDPSNFLAPILIISLITRKI